jgi:hypothetical protein
VVWKAGLPSTLTEKSTFLKLWRTSRLRCAGRRSSAAAAEAGTPEVAGVGTAAGVATVAAGAVTGDGGTGAGFAVGATSAPVGVSGIDDHQGAASRAVNATAPVICAINGKRAWTGSQRGQTRESQREAFTGSFVSGVTAVTAPDFTPTRARIQNSEVTVFPLLSGIANV